MEEKKYWVGFNLIKGLGAVVMQGLVVHFGDLESAWNAELTELMEAGLGAKLATNVLTARKQIDLNQVGSRIETQGIKILTWADEEHPARLKEIDQPPPVLYLRGEYWMDDLFAVAIVGTRKVTPNGRQVTEDIASFLAANGITVISERACEVDAVAHQAVLKAGGRTMAVPGSGVDKIYPPGHCGLPGQMMEGGAVIRD